MKLEICCYSIDDIKMAVVNGADRIEFCSGRSDGGLTPSYGDLIQLAELQLSIPIHPIVRPRGGDFCYNQTEIKSMLNDIALIKELNFAGVVFGALNIFGQIDNENIVKLQQAAEGLSMTFHRAFDVCKDPLQTLTHLEDLGFNRILTSGQQATAIEGVALLNELNQHKRSMIIMPGSGVKSTNIQQLVDIGLTEFHTSATKTIHSPMQYLNPNVSMSHTQNNESLRYQIDIDEVKSMKKIISQHSIIN